VPGPPDDAVVHVLQELSRSAHGTAAAAARAGTDARAVRPRSLHDAILRTAVDLGLDVLELQSICTEPEDYANPIEPSGQGGLKIARAVSRLVGAVDCGGVLPGRV